MSDTGTISDKASPPLTSRLLEWTLRSVGALWVLFFAFMTFAGRTKFGVEDNPIGKLSAWGTDGYEYVLMICALNIGLGGYLFLSANNPVKYRYVIDLFLVCETLHILTMASMASMPAHHMHWLGDVLSGIIGVGLVAAVWLPVRRRVIAAAEGS